MPSSPRQQRNGNNVNFNKKRVNGYNFCASSPKINKTLISIIFLTDCPLNVQSSLEMVMNQALCVVSPSCADVTCCVNVPILNRTFEVGINIDYSYEKIMVHVEKIYRRHHFIGFEFAENHTLSLAGVFKLR